MYTFLDSVVQIFPAAIQPFIWILLAMFVLFTIVSIVATIIWVINQIKELFHIL